MPLLRNERPAVPELAGPGELKPAFAIHSFTSFNGHQSGIFPKVSL